MTYSVTLVFILNLVLRAVCCAQSSENLVKSKQVFLRLGASRLCGPHNYVLAVVSGSRFSFLKKTIL